jgi:hypothetical protein
MANSDGLILHKTRHEGGRKHDYNINKYDHPITPSQVENIFDLGYLGVEKDFPTVKFVLPIKKKRNGGRCFPMKKELTIRSTLG